MTLDTKRLRELANAATPGPWRWRFGCVEQLSDAGKGYPLDTYPDCDTIQESQCHECGTAIGLGERNGEFVAAANPATVIALLDQIDCGGKGCGTDEAKACLRCCRILIANGRANHGDACDAENERLRSHLQRSSANHERFERLFYLALHELEDTGGEFARARAAELEAEAKAS